MPELFLDVRPNLDGNMLGFIHNGELELLEVTSGTRKNLSNGLKLSTGTEYGGEGKFCFSVDNTKIFFTSKGQLYVVDIESGSIESFTQQPKEWKCYSLSTSQTHLYFTVEEETTMSLGRFRLNSIASEAIFEKRSAGDGSQSTNFVYDCVIWNPVGSTKELIAYQWWYAPYMAWDNSAIVLFENGIDQIPILLEKDNQSCIAQPRFSPGKFKIDYLAK